MDFMSILGRCLLLPFPVAMFVGCLFQASMIVLLECS